MVLRAGEGLTPTLQILILSAWGGAWRSAVFESFPGGWQGSQVWDPRQRARHGPSRLQKAASAQ